MENPVERPVTALVEPVPDVRPLLAGTGLAPASAANPPRYGTVLGWES